MARGPPGAMYHYTYHVGCLVVHHSEIHPMVAINLPHITDVREIPYLSDHPKKFFEAMDDLKPYVLTDATENSISIESLAEHLTYDELRGKCSRLNDLGYYVVYDILCTKGSIELGDIVIRWSPQEKNMEQL